MKKLHVITAVAFTLAMMNNTARGVEPLDPDDQRVENIIALNIYNVRCRPLPPSVKALVDIWLKLPPFSTGEAIPAALRVDKLRIENGDEAFCNVVEVMILNPLIGKKE